MTDQRKTRVAVVFGGRSTEHAVSCASAGLVLGALDPAKYEVVPIGIARDGRWVLTSGDPSRLALTSGDLPSVALTLCRLRCAPQELVRRFVGRDGRRRLGRDAVRTA